MEAQDTVRRNKTAIQETLCGDHSLILNKVHEKNLITKREYNNLRSISKESVEGHVIALVDKVMNKGEETCQAFLNLLQTDEDIKTTFPDLKKIQFNDRSLLPHPVQASSLDTDVLSQERKRRREEDLYPLNSQPTGLCVIINNENFMFSKDRRGTNKDAQSLAEVFSWLGFRVLMCKDQTGDEMDQALNCFASLSNLSRLQELGVKEWIGNGFNDLQKAPEHGDAFICCILSHGKSGVVLGIDGKPLSIKQVTRTFKGSNQSALTGKPKVFLIQACQTADGTDGIHPGALLKDLQSDDSQALFIPEVADVLVAIATVEDYRAYRHITHGSWFVQSVCQQLKEGYLRGDDMTTILHRVNNDVCQKEAAIQPGKEKQMPEFRSTLRKRLVLSPHHN
ncbi:caspase 20, apoptosis-related cysteine peptidase [Symphorus nematophorus]